MTYTAQDVRAMDIAQISELIKKKTGKPIDSGTGVFLAMAHGSARAGGGGVLAINLDTGENGVKAPDYEGFAELFNGPDVPEEIRPEYTVSIPRPDQFLKVYDMARNADPEVYRKFVDDIMGLIVWGMREYRESLNIYPDSKTSFYWTFMEKDRVVFNGGLINHGDDEKPSWSVHT